MGRWQPDDELAAAGMERAVEVGRTDVHLGAELVRAPDPVDDVLVPQGAGRHGPGLLGPCRLIGLAAEEHVVGHPHRLAGRELPIGETGKAGDLAPDAALDALEMRRDAGQGSGRPSRTPVGVRRPIAFAHSVSVRAHRVRRPDGRRTYHRDPWPTAG